MTAGQFVAVLQLLVAVLRFGAAHCSALNFITQHCQTTRLWRVKSGQSQQAGGIAWVTVNPPSNPAIELRDGGNTYTYEYIHPALPYGQSTYSRPGGPLFVAAGFPAPQPVCIARCSSLCASLLGADEQNCAFRSRSWPQRRCAACTSPATPSQAANFRDAQ